MSAELQLSPTYCHLGSIGPPEASYNPISNSFNLINELLNLRANARPVKPTIDYYSGSAETALLSKYWAGLHSGTAVCYYIVEDLNSDYLEKYDNSRLVDETNIGEVDDFFLAASKNYGW